MRWVFVVAVGLLALGAVASAASAAERPNALDVRVDAISRSALLTQPATLLVDATRQAAAIRRAHWTVFGFVLTQIFEAAALFYLWSSGAAGRLRDRLRRRFHSEWSVRFVFGATLALVARLAAFAPSFYLYRVDRTLDLTFELTRWWGVYWIFHTFVAMIVAGLIAAIVLGLVSRTHQWYVYAIAGILAASVGWAYVSAYATPPVTPLGAALVSPLRAEAARAGFPNLPIDVEQLRDAPGDKPTAVGLGPSERILLSNLMVAASTLPELEYAVAFEIGHVKFNDPLAMALIEGGIIVIFASIAVVIADRFPFRRDDDPLSRLAIVGALLALVYLGAVPTRNAALRSYDFGADAYAVTLTGDAAAAVRTLVRSGDQRMEEVCPELTAALFLYTEPGIGARVAAINHVPARCP
ncbi:MAG: M48 family metalloprotease [Candidatus Eremiobacteraeota bacterium]|nr:M48 family metalloprotease [Candidatus Eremiobacteraeota bacterium]